MSVGGLGLTRGEELRIRQQQEDEVPAQRNV
jgi:hypothetical protein